MNAVAVLAGGDYLVAGKFERAGGVPARCIARYNPTTGVWSAVGNTSAVNRIYALASLPGGDVIVGGDFLSIGGILANNIARYNSTTGVWSDLGAGINDFVYSLANQSNGSVVVGGLFTTAGGAAANGIARITPGANAPSINFQPLPVITAPTATVKFGVSAAAGFGSSGMPTYQWRKGGLVINAGTNPSAATPILTLTNVQISDVGSYSCLVTNSCGGLGSESASVPLSFVTDPCPADFNQDGIVDLFDYLDFVAAFSVGC